MRRLPAWTTPVPAADLPAVPRPARRWTRRAAARLERWLADYDQQPPTAGWLGGLDARAKVVGSLCLILAATLITSPLALAAGWAGCLLIAWSSGLPLGRFLALWLVAPLFTLIIMLPATLDLVTPGRPLLVLWADARWRLGPWALPTHLSVTVPGLLAAVRMVLRTGLCTTLAVLAAASTPPGRLFHALRVLGVPRIFVMILAMMQRYLRLLVHAAHELHLARLSRTIGGERLAGGHRFVAFGLGALFRRTRALGEAVYLAMLSRGYTGEARLLAAPGWQARDLACMVLCAALLAAAWWCR